MEEFDMRVCEFKELDCGFGGGFYMCLYLAWHWHVVCVHVHLRSRSGIVSAGGV